MQQDKSQDSLSTKIKNIFWPIESYELKKFLPMALMMGCILFNYAMFRSVKDGLIVPNIGAEAIGFLKTYFVMPSAILAMIAYAKLCNVMTQRGVFNTILFFFIGYFALFTFILYPNADFFHPDADSVEAITASYPVIKWFVRIFGKWTYATFYILAELWGSVMLSLLFWQFANKIVKTDEAKRFYAMFGMLGNIALIFVFLFADYLLSDDVHIVADEIKLMPLLALSVVSGLAIFFLYRWINENVLTDPKLYDPENVTKKKKKEKLSLKDSFRMIFTSPYIGLVAMLVLSYGISMVLIEGVWKNQVRILYPTTNEYTAFMTQFQFYQGIVAILFMLIGSNILRSVSWLTAALFTPVMILITGLGFFAFIFFGNSFGLWVAAYLGTGPVALAVIIGTAQNVLSKGVKYSLFDSTKEMSYIPLNTEMKTKGKAAVDIVGGRLGKSGGGAIATLIFMLFPSFDYADATPIFAVIAFIIVCLWIISVVNLNKLYKIKLAEKEKEQED